MVTPICMGAILAAKGGRHVHRALPACLFQATDYLQGAREHRRMIAGAEPLKDDASR